MVLCHRFGDSNDSVTVQYSCAKLRRDGEMSYICKETELQTGLKRLRAVCKPLCPQTSALPYHGGDSVPLGDQKTIEILREYLPDPGL